MTSSSSADFDVRALHAALDAKRQARGLSWAGVAREISDPFGLTPAIPVGTSTMTRMCERAAIEGDGVLQMLLWLERTPESFVPGSRWATAEEARLPSAGPHHILRFDAAGMHAALDARRRERGATWTQVAREIGSVPAAGLTRLAKGGRVAFPWVMRVFAWLDRPVAAFTRKSEW